MTLPADSDDRVGIADLELYGLSQRTINFLEDQFGFLYIDELQGLTEAQMREIPRCGNRMVETLRRALRNWVDGRPVKTVEQCVRM